MQEIRVQSLGWEVPLEKGMATHSSTAAWRIPVDRGAWRASNHRVTGVRHKWATNTHRSSHRKRALLFSHRASPGVFLKPAPSFRSCFLDLRTVTRCVSSGPTCCCSTTPPFLFWGVSGFSSCYSSPVVTPRGLQVGPTQVVRQGLFSLICKLFSQ